MTTGMAGSLRLEDFRHEALDEVGSTNALCFEKARDGDPGLLWLTAKRQMAGKGRRGRPWISEAGNLYVSLLLIDPAPVLELGSLPLAAALAVYRGLAAEIGFAAERLAIKWPNDILFDGAKLCGILVEAERLADGRQAVVIGCGVNIAHKPDQPHYPAATLLEAGVVTDPESLLARFMVAFAETLSDWDRGQGLPKIVGQWRTHVTGIGRPITVNLPDRSIDGIFHGVGDDGLLMLKLDDGSVRTIASGDVFFQNK